MPFSFGTSRAGDELTSTNASRPSGTKTNGAFSFASFFAFVWPPHPDSFSIVWEGTVRLFFSPLSPRDPKWDIDILAGSFLGLALDAPECSA